VSLKGISIQILIRKGKKKKTKTTNKTNNKKTHQPHRFSV
jgi:hypothetical protein